MPRWFGSCGSKKKKPGKDGVDGKHKGAQKEKLSLKRSNEEEIGELSERPRKKSEKYENEKITLKQGHQKEFENRNEEIRRQKERTQEREQGHYSAAQTKQNEKDALLEAECERLKRKLEESENENAALKIGHKEEIGSLKGEIRRLNERKKEQEHVKHQDTNTEQNERDISVKEEYEKLNRKLEESENENATLKIGHKDEIGRLEEEIRKLQESSQLEAGLGQHHCHALELAQHKISMQQRFAGECRGLEKQNSEINARCSSLQTEITSLTIKISSHEKTVKELKTRCDELEAENTSYKENWTKSDNVNIQLELKIKEKENVAKELEKKSEEAEHEIKVWKNRYNSMEQEKKRIEEEQKSLEQEKRRIEEDLKRVEAKNNQLTRQLENERKAKEDAILRVEAKNNQLTSQLENERKAKEDALLRLSSMASNKLRDNNPNIADLSDPNRPTKLSEQFSELYDNEWTDAFDDLEKHFDDKDDIDDKKIISYLRDFVLEIHSVCSNLSSSKLKTIQEAFVEPSVPSEETKVPSEIIKTIKDGIKSIAPKLLEHIRKRVLDCLETKFSTEPVAGCLQSGNVKRYIDKCTEVCWYMSVQDPQLVMEGSKSPDGKFDSNKHREYTKKGPYEEFVVWPALYLYQGGQMLSKGVAQGAKKEMSEQQ